MPRIKPVEQRRAGTANVKIARWAGSKSNSNTHKKPARTLPATQLPGKLGGLFGPAGLFEGAEQDVLVFNVHDLAAVELQADVAFSAALVVGQLRRNDAVDFHCDVGALGR